MHAQRIGLLGASFDPPHRGHLTIALTTVARRHFDQVWLVPTRQHPLSKQLTPTEHRLAMTRLMLRGVEDQPVHLERFELDHEGPSYTIDTLRHFRELRPTDSFSWIIGADNLVTFPQWHRYQELLAEFKVFVYPRPGYSMEPILPGMIPLKGVPEIDVSSTDIRQRVAAGQAITGLVEPAVAQYITEQRLYT